MKSIFSSFFNFNFRCCKMSTLSIIPTKDLPRLRNLYEVGKPLHVLTTVAIGHFIKRFETKPEWAEIVRFWSLNDDWKQTGAFAMANANDDHIMFNTKEVPPFNSLHKLLQLLNYEKPLVFICFRDRFRPIVLDVIRIRNLEITFDSGTRNIYIDVPPMMNEIEAPDGYYFDVLNLTHVEKINSTWKHRHSRSHEYLANCIKHNPSTGLFVRGSGELIAWATMAETGTMGNLHVDAKYQRNGFGEAVTAVQAFKICRTLGYDFTFHILHQNRAAFEMTTKFGGQWIDNNSWIGIRPKEPPMVVPLWGRL